MDKPRFTSRTLGPLLIAAAFPFCARAALGEQAALADSSPAGGMSAFTLDYVQPHLPPKSEGDALARWKDKHPRILVPEGGLAELQQRAKTTHAKIAALIVKHAEEIIGDGVNTSPKNSESGMRWEVRKPGQLAWAYAATGDVKYRAAAIRWALAVCAYPHWDIDVDLAASHGLVAIAQVYDWFFADLSAEEKKILLDKLRAQGRLMDSVYGPVKVKGGTWWTKSFLQNHGMVNNAGLYAAGLAVYGELPEAAEWLAHAEAHFETVFSILNEDGASMEGMNYWGYGVEHVMLYAELARHATGRDFFAASGFLRNAGRFFQGLTTPWLRPGDHVIPFGAPAVNVGTHGPSHILFKCAAETRDPVIQDLAETCLERDLDSGASMRAYSLLYADMGVGRRPYTAAPTTCVYPELGIASARGSWNEDATLLWFKCGSFQNRAATRVLQRNVGSGHARADQTEIQLVSRGERLTAYGNSESANHSYPLFRGTGQLGEESDKQEAGLNTAEAWTASRQPELLKAATSPRANYFAGDATGIYRAAAGLQRYRRHVVYVKPDDVLLVDEIALDEGARKEGARAPDVAWNLQVLPEPRVSAKDRAVAAGQKAALDVFLCAPAEGFELSASSPPPNKGYMMPEIFWNRKRLTVASTGPVRDAVLVTALHCRGAGDPEGNKPEVEVQGTKVRAKIATASGVRTVELDLAALSCEVR